MHKLSNIFGWTILFFIGAATIEISAYAAYHFVILPKAKFLTYQTPEIVKKDDYDKYITDRDPDLGWPGKEMLGSKKYDLSGSRPVPVFPEPGNECVSLYGDSFVYGSGVEDESSWGNILSRQLGCRVGNFGVAGYGTDQSLLRFSKNLRDKAPITILGIFPHNVMRNVNQHRYLLVGGEFLSFKPRYTLRDGQLQLVKLPGIDFEDIDRYLQEPGDYLKHEEFLPGEKFGPVRFSFPYSLPLIQLLLKERVLSWLMNTPSWAPFLQARHSSQALEVTARVSEKFIGLCKERLKKCFVITFPTPSSYSQFRETGEFVMQPLITRLDASQIPVLNLTRELANYLGEKSICAILLNSGQCSGHFNADGNAIISNIVHKYMTEKSM